MTNILFLYSELAGYMLACMQELHRLYGWEVHVVHWPVNPEAPFEFGQYEGIHFYDRATYSSSDILTLYEKLRPSAVYVSGWMDKGYVQVAKQINSSKIPVICGSDNHWRGDIRQRIATLISPWYLKTRYSHMWVPGIYQYEFARRLGYAPSQILTGMYAADVDPFNAIYEDQKHLKAQSYPHNFLYVGRYVAIKGVQELCEAFVNLSQELPHDWTLTMVGAGELKGQLPKHERIQYRSFVQPQELPSLAAEAGCFVLPSQKEPWGVVIHEFAAAGLPIITSSTCGAGTALVRHGYNGFIHQAKDRQSLQYSLRQIIQSSDQQLLEMGRKSAELSTQLSPEIWAHTLASVLPPHAVKNQKSSAVSR